MSRSSCGGEAMTLRSRWAKPASCFSIVSCSSRARSILVMRSISSTGSAASMRASASFTFAIACSAPAGE